MKAQRPATTSGPQPSAPAPRIASSGGRLATVPRVVREVLDSAGEPLDPTSRADMESRFGHDFSRVRVHADTRAAESALAVDAAAYTMGQHIAFGAGRYAPGTLAGRRLLAHELTHVVQQGRSVARHPLGIAPAGIQRSPLSDAVRADVEKAPPPEFEALLARLGNADVQAAQADADVDAEVARLLAGRADELWVAQRVRQGRLGQTTGALGPRVAGRPVARPIEAFFFRGVTQRRALVIAGVHGTERQGIEVARRLIADLETQQPHFTVIVVPSLFPDNAAAARFGRRESGSTPTNRNFPRPTEDLAAARKAGGGSRAVDALERAILPENLMLMELMERFRPERIISIHGTHQPSAAGVFFDPRSLRDDEVAAAYRWAAESAYAHPRSRVNYTSEGEEQTRAEVRDKLFRQRLRQLGQQASDEDRALSLAAAAQIDVATARIKAAGGRSMPRREDDPAIVPALEQAAREAHPSVAGNVGTTGALDRASWSGGVPGGVSLGGYAPPRGMSVFTVEPAINRNTADYPTPLDPITVDDRRIELQSYADAVRTVLLGRP